MRTKSLVVGLCVSLALAAAACVPSEADTDVEDVVSYDRDTTMGRLQREGKVTFAIPADLGPFSSIDADGNPRGFVAEFASEIAASLGVSAGYVPASGEESLEMVRQGRVDIAFPSVGVTEALARQNNLSGPYWVAHKRLLVHEESPVQGPEDLQDGADVCQYEEEHTRTDIAEIFPGVSSSDEPDFRRCADRLRGGGEAATAPDVYLIALAAELSGHEIRGEQLSTVGYSAALPRNAADLRTFVNTVLTEVKSEGRWLQFYEEWLEPVANREGVNAPDLTLEEAATLWPRDLR